MCVRFFYLLLEAVKKRNAKLSSIAVETRKATKKDKDHIGDASETTAVSAVLFKLFWKTSLLLCLFCAKYHKPKAFTYLTQGG